MPVGRATIPLPGQQKTMRHAARKGRCCHNWQTMLKLCTKADYLRECTFSKFKACSLRRLTAQMNCADKPRLRLRGGRLLTQPPEQFKAAAVRRRRSLTDGDNIASEIALTGYSGGNSTQEHITWAGFTQNRNAGSDADGPRPHVCTDNGRNIARLRIPAKATVQDSARSALQLNIKDDAVRFATVNHKQAFVTTGRDAYMIVRLT